MFTIIPDTFYMYNSNQISIKIVKIIIVTGHSPSRVTSRSRSLSPNIPVPIGKYNLFIVIKGNSHVATRSTVKSVHSTEGQYLF